MDAGKEAIEKIEELALDGMTKEVDGRTYSVYDLKPVFYEPRPEPVIVKTLSGFVDFIKTNIDSLDLKKHVIHVVDHETVSLLKAVDGDDMKRDIFLKASLDEGLETYPFGKYLQVESFVIALRSMFEPGNDLEKLITYVSRVRGGTNFSLEDDGVSQTATVAKGVSGALTEKETAPAIVKLRPFRTFREIEQIESEFLFRMKLIDTETKIVGVALFEADGGRWRNEAVINIKEYLHEKLPDMAIVA